MLGRSRVVMRRCGKHERGGGVCPNLGAGSGGVGVSAIRATCSMGLGKRRETPAGDYDVMS